MIKSFFSERERDHIVWKEIIYIINENVLRLLNLCATDILTIINTSFRRPNKYKTWIHRCPKHWHLIDFVVTWRLDTQDVHITRALRGAECNINRRIIRSVVQLKIRLSVRKDGAKKQLNRSPFKDQFRVFELQVALASAIEVKPPGMGMGTPTGNKLTEKWEYLLFLIYYQHDDFWQSPSPACRLV